MWMLLASLRLSAGLASAGAADGGVTLSVWNNSAWTGLPHLSEVRPGLAFQGDLPTGSTLEMVGTLELPAGSTEYNFSCSFANTTMGFLWIDDHLVCQDGNVYKPPVSRTDLPLKRLSKASLPVVLRAYTAPSQRSRGNASFVGNFFDGDHGLSGPRVLRFGPQSYGFSPQSCADACTQYLPCTIIALPLSRSLSLSLSRLCVRACACAAYTHECSPVQVHLRSAPRRRRQVLAPRVSRCSTWYA